jgi:uncharacterized tellurite resistance protein B-like protein
MSNQENNAWFNQAFKIANKLKDVASDASSQAGEFLEDATSQVKKATSEIAGQTASVISAASEQAGQFLGDATSQAKKAANEITEQTASLVSDASSQAGGFLGNATSQVKRATTEIAGQTTSAASDASSQAGQFLGDATSQAKKAVSELGSQISQTVSGDVGNRQMNEQQESLDLSQIEESIRLDFYGALFSIATADGQLDKDEMELIFGMMDLENMSEDAKRQVQSYVINPPALGNCLARLSNSDERLRFGLMVNMVDTAWANDELDPNEEKAILLAQQELKVTDEQLEAIKSFIQKMREIRSRGIDDNYAADAIKTAAAGLSSVGVPLAAVWFSGSVIGFSAAGITSGLAGLGAMIGLGGMIPGIGVAIVAGAGIFMGVNWLLDTGDHRKKEQIKAERERKAQLVILNMQGAINTLVEQITSLQEKTINLESSAASAEASREAIRILTERLKFMQQSVTKRKQAIGAT